MLIQTAVPAIPVSQIHCGKAQRGVTLLAHERSITVFWFVLAANKTQSLFFTP